MKELVNKTHCKLEVFIRLKVFCIVSGNVYTLHFGCMIEYDREDTGPLHVLG